MMSINPVLPFNLTLASLLEKLRPMCWGAADILLAYSRRENPPYGFPSVLEVQEGSDGPVSVADLAVNTWLLEGLKSSFKQEDWILLSEETVKKQFAVNKSVDSEWLWILDPLDGTKDFLEGSTDYAVHLALVHFNRPVLGIVLIPELEELWFGGLGVGTWCENRLGDRISPSFSNRRLESDLLLVTSRSHRDLKLEKLLERIPFLSGKKVGSVGCKVATLLRGEADIYISLSGKTAPKDWDMAAPEAVLIAAGGGFTHVDGSTLEYNKGDWQQAGCLVASHGFKHPQICKKIMDELRALDDCVG